MVSFIGFAYMDYSRREFCRPVIDKEAGKPRRERERAWRDSNARPLVPETNTLSAELQAHIQWYIISNISF